MSAYWNLGARFFNRSRLSNNRAVKFTVSFICSCIEFIITMYCSSFIAQSDPFTHSLCSNETGRSNDLTAHWCDGTMVQHPESYQNVKITSWRTGFSCSFDIIYKQEFDSFQLSSIKIKSFIVCIVVRNGLRGVLGKKHRSQNMAAGRVEGRGGSVVYLKSGQNWNLCRY